MKHWRTLILILSIHSEEIIASGDPKDLIIGSTIAGGIVNIVPSLLEYNRHPKEETSFLAIYTGGLLSGSFILALTFKSAFSENPFPPPVVGTIFSIVGMIVGNKIGHYLYSKNRVRNYQFLPAITTNQLHLNFSYNY